MAKGYHVDAIDIGSIKELSNKIKNDFDHIDILVNAVGGNMKVSNNFRYCFIF